MSDETPDNVVPLMLVEAGEHFKCNSDEMLDAAKGMKYKRLVIFGEYEEETDEGDSYYLASNCSIGEALILFEKFKRFVI